MNLIDKPSFDLSPDADKFLTDTNEAWTALQQRRADATRQRDEVATMPAEQIGKTQIAQLRKAKAELFDASKAELTLLRHVSNEWPTLYREERIRALNAAHEQHSLAIANVVNSLREMGFQEQPGEIGKVTLNFFAGQHPSVASAIHALVNAQNATTGDHVPGPEMFRRQIAALEAELRRSAEAMAA